MILLIIITIISNIIIMSNTNAHKYAKNGNVIELQKAIQRDRNVVHGKDVVRVY